MRLLSLALCVLCVGKIYGDDRSYLPFVDEKHPTRYYLFMTPPPMLYYGPDAHFKIYYLDSETNEIQKIFKVKRISMDEKGCYFLEKDIIEDVK